MWIKTQDGRRIINTDNIVGIGVSRRIYQNGTVDIYASIAQPDTSKFDPHAAPSSIILGTYPREEVMDRFNEICRCGFTYLDLSEGDKTNAE